MSWNDVAARQVVGLHEVGNARVIGSAQGPESVSTAYCVRLATTGSARNGGRRGCNRGSGISWRGRDLGVSWSGGSRRIDCGSWVCIATTLSSNPGNSIRIVRILISAAAVRGVIDRRDAAHATPRRGGEN